MSGNIYQNGMASTQFNEYFPSAMTIKPTIRYGPTDCFQPVIHTNLVQFVNGSDYEMVFVRRGGGELPTISSGTTRLQPWYDLDPVIRLIRKSEEELEKKIDEVKQQNEKTHQLFNANIMQSIQAVQATIKEQTEQSNAKMMGDLMPVITDLKNKQQEMADSQRRWRSYDYKPDYRPTYNRGERY